MIRDSYELLNYLWLKNEVRVEIPPHEKFFFLLSFSSTYIRKKYWIHENFRHPVFDGFTAFEMFWTLFDRF